MSIKQAQEPTFQTSSENLTGDNPILLESIAYTTTDQNVRRSLNHVSITRAIA
ncbi:hypothetical protein [Cylindrospermopsis raciborskii]|uniref:hypothetical protein n=1 Tax=Cylindrospermopsis raciborskii TaxID=77022 RepID=UPI0015A6CAED|nr:hypothetical protein [Cylindrospermopsis raciborskii]